MSKYVSSSMVSADWTLRLMREVRLFAFEINVYTDGLVQAEVTVKVDDRRRRVWTIIAWPSGKYGTFTEILQVSVGKNVIFSVPGGDRLAETSHEEGFTKLIELSDSRSVRNCILGIAKQASTYNVKTSGIHDNITLEKFEESSEKSFVLKKGAASVFFDRNALESIFNEFGSNKHVWKPHGAGSYTLCISEPYECNINFTDAEISTIRMLAFKSIVGNGKYFHYDPVSSIFSSPGLYVYFTLDFMREVYGLNDVGDITLRAVNDYDDLMEFAISNNYSDNIMVGIAAAKKFRKFQTKNKS